MKIRIGLLSLFLALCSLHCSKKTSVGKYFPSLPMADEKFFIHEIENANDLKKITDGSYNYYSWKTIEYNDTIKNNETGIESCFSFYKSILNEEIQAFEIDKQRYIVQPGHLLLNNLYFLDDNRCIYVSFDDERSNDDRFHYIPLYLDDKHYKPPKKVLKRLEQYLRGYYSVKGEDVFIHFENPNSRDNFLVNAKIIDGKIEFVSMTVPNSPSDLYKDGYNTEYIDFDKIFYKDAMPIFEWVKPIKDIVYPPQKYLTMGFENYRNKEKLNKLHKKIIEDNEDLQLGDTLIITNIDYGVDSNSSPYREYSVKLLNESKIYLFQEKIGLDALQDTVLINTW